MTCIVGYIKDDKVYIGGDSAGVAGLDIHERKDAKVFKVGKGDGKFLIGYTSSFRMGQLLRFKLKVPKQTTKQTDYQYMCTTFIDKVRDILKEGGYAATNSNVDEIGTFLVGYKGHLYFIGNDLQVGENVSPYNSVGCGSRYAFGALYILSDYCDFTPVEVVEAALQAAARFSGGVRPPFIIESI